VRIAFRVSNLFLITLVSLALAPDAFAQNRRVEHPDHVMHPGAEATPRGYDRETEQNRDQIDANRAERNGGEAPVDRVEHPEAARRAVAVPGGGIPGVGVPGRGVAPRADVRRNGCVYHRGRVRVAGCDYYYDDDGDYYDYEGEQMTGWSPDQPWPAGATASPQSTTAEDASPGAAKLAPAPGPEDYDQHYAPDGNNALRDALIAGRKNWMQKKAMLDDANGAVARAEYKKYETGAAVDPSLVERQQQAQREADAARDALAPLVEQAREAGMSPRLLELYNEMNDAD
jgi:hypothetical protein